MNDYINYWLPIFKRMYFKYKLQDDIRAIVELEDNIWKNWRFTKEEIKEFIEILEKTTEEFYKGEGGEIINAKY